jgi:hypothetical protein
VDAHAFTKQAEMSAIKLIDGNWFLGQERSADGGIQAMRYHNDVRSVWRNIIKNCREPFRTKGIVEC